MELIISFVLLVVIVAVVRYATKNSESSESVNFALRNDGFDLNVDAPFESKPSQITSAKSTKKATVKGKAKKSTAETPTVSVKARRTSKKDSTSTSTSKTSKKSSNATEPKKEVKVKTRGKSGKRK